MDQSLNKVIEEELSTTFVRYGKIDRPLGSSQRPLVMRVTRITVSRNFL